MGFGIHDLALKTPSLYLPIEDLARERKIEPAKLEKGLGLINMSVCDADEDVVTLAAGAVLQLIKQNPKLTPAQIGRIYVGTESSIDGSKPIATYVHGILEQYYEQKGKSNALNHTDAIDMTFACIGAIDAMQNSLAWLHQNPDKVAIVIAADIANYDLDSSGEYTQGAGAVAVLVKKDPALLEINENWGVAAKSEHDFFKPIRYELINNEVVSIYDEKPIFDGQFSNTTYYNRMVEALRNGGQQDKLLDYNGLVFHLPYAYHGRRIITNQIIAALDRRGELETICKQEGISPSDEKFTKVFSKTSWYKNWINTHIASGETYSSHMGNLYTASIFLSIMSMLKNGNLEQGNNLLFIAYGSGSKAKTFAAKLAQDFGNKIALWNCDDQLSNRDKIDFNQYLALRKRSISAVSKSDKEVKKTASGITETNRFSRDYTFKDL